jgi:tripeptidyl-peptidase-1
MSKSLTWVKFDATVEEAESLLRTEYHVYTNANTGEDYLAVEDYSVPAHIRDHIDFITPTVHFDATVKQTPKRRDLERRDIKGKPVSHAMQGAQVSAQETTYNLTNCDKYTTPDCLRALYSFTNGSLAL